VLAVRSTETLGAQLAEQEPGQIAAKDLATTEPAEGWQRLSAGAGSKGERLYGWARWRLCRLQEQPWEQWLLVRRKIANPEELAYYVRVRSRRHEPADLGVGCRSALAHRGVLQSRQAGSRPG
jgi:hypothetical protein